MGGPRQSTMDLNQLNQLDFNRIGEWPTPAKAVFILFLCLVLAGGWYWFLTLDQLDNLSQAEAKEVELRATFESRQRLAANLQTHQEQLREMEEFLRDLMRQLPGNAEIAALLVDVSQTGVALGLEFELFKPAAEIVKTFYAELPIQVAVLGAYHDLAGFVSGLAALPRIVTVHDISIASLDKEVRGPTAASKLRLQATVKTYRYLEETEIGKAQASAKPGQTGKGGK